MPTFGDIEQRIADDFLLRRDLSAQTKNAIKSSIRFFERQRFWFNETATATTTSSGGRFVSAPSNMLTLDLFEITHNSSDYVLKQVDLQLIQEMNVIGSTGLPTHFAEYNDQFELSLIPDSAYPVTLHYLKQLPALSADVDTNAWLDHAEDVITFRAAKMVWGVTLRETEEAMKFAVLEREALGELYRTRDQRMMRAIKATKF